MRVFPTFLTFLLAGRTCHCTNIRGNVYYAINEVRKLAAPYYYETESLGEVNFAATMGNPMKGLIGNPFTNDPKNWPSALPATIHHYKLALSDVMFGDPDVIGAHVAFNWTSIDQKLQLARTYNSHAVFRFFIHWPGIPLFIPNYLLRDPYKVQTVWHNNEVAPYYGDPNLRRAFMQFIDHFARRYDGDTRLFAIQAGLIGAWGEWHGVGCTFNGQRCDTEQSKQEVVQWYAKYWKKTKIQFRYPERKDAADLGFGFHDDSYTLETISGPPNGGVQHTYMFWNSSVIAGTSDFWRRAPSSGEVRPENQNAFDPNFPSGTEWHQDPMVCAEIAHTTFVDWGRGFANNNGVMGVTGGELSRAQYVHARMGYNFQLVRIAVSSPSNGKVSIDATIRQVGVAPFYYPLYLDLYCEGAKRAYNWIGGDLTDKGKTTVVSLNDIPATSSCLNRVELRLDSYHLYPERPMKWAQGMDGRIMVTLPLPPPSTGGTIDRCYVVCAANVCPGDKKNGDLLHEISSSRSIALEETGKQVSIRCDTKGLVNKVKFKWPGVEWTESASPWAMFGNIGTSFAPVEYLSNTGLKSVTVTASTSFITDVTRTLEFSVTEKRTG